MKVFQKVVIFLLSNIISTALAHEGIHITNNPIQCKDSKDPIYILDENSLGVIGHGNHNYIPVCPEDVPNIKSNSKRSLFHKAKKFHHNFHDGQRHNVEYDKPNINKIVDVIENKNVTAKNSLDTLDEFDLDDDQDEYEDEIQPSSAFEIQFYCQATPNICEKAKNSFEKATQKIAIALKIKTQIIVQASLYSFCEVKGDSNCGNNSSIGSAAASAYHILSNNGTKFLYPQPLVKQMDDVGVYLATDITSDFNSDYSFYFSGDPVIEDGQIDFEYVVIHELIHGMGFATGFQKYFSLVAKVIDDQDFLSPGLSLINNTYVSNWRSIQIFDKSVVSTVNNVSLNTYNNDIMKFTSTSGLVSPLQYHNEFIRSVGPYKAAKRVLEVASNKTGSLVFQTSKGDRINLYTKENEFLQGTSIAHLSDEFKYSSDFIMISDVSPLQGKTISMMYDEYGKDKNGKRHEYGAIGPSVLKILNEIGWEIADPPPNIYKFYDDPLTVTVVSDAKLKYNINHYYILFFSIIFFLYN
ncbi:hypothetical protein H8356DRAFT_1738594 [Neocallimastix lanati (nom. inval.)]|jgi:hypothetical protein|uniref:Sequence orphan n=1 Tax=Neocallimastix californiae TaxID=1754190 RepID=A0A1Y2CFZ5_9FUNG|nr:hypothetical protein H8356DRAFT_1738594 [Neocallimastix sp. JGI-2020a]ORY45837.1 hypothetical protein LY90DRAFT_509454 [Neocallimastix californiae]|eukprot:ORY45837.1 hypothetical protein LY90DRAFT_509454 [Neocallimastix californiae]